MNALAPVAASEPGRPRLSPVSEVASRLATTPEQVMSWRINQVFSNLKAELQQQIQMLRLHHSYGLACEMSIAACNRAAQRLAELEERRVAYSEDRCEVCGKVVDCCGNCRCEDGAR